MSTDRIEKRILLKASQSRVWKAISDSKEFGTWFGMKLEGPFIAGQTIHGSIFPTQVDPEIAAMQKPYTGKPATMYVEKIEPETRLQLKWNPFAIDPNMDYSKEPMTLITFSLDPKGDDTLLTITESGFDKIPATRRAEALKANDGGWEAQTRLIEKYLQRK